MEQTSIDKAWDILLPDEKTALNLSAGMGKSSWEAGEIMTKAHYKYLEIQKRSEQYLKMFKGHFEKYGTLIPEMKIDTTFAKYIKLVLGDRKKVKDVINKMSKTDYSISYSKTNGIINEMTRLSKADDDESKDLYALIMDFDRWNNFRILPKEIQEPSAFKRRNKVRDLKHLELSLDIPTLSLGYLSDTYEYKGKLKSNYAVLIDRNGELNDINILRVSAKKELHTEQLTKMFIYMFDKTEEAQEFAELLITFPKRGNRTCKDGLKFWPLFRILSQKAINYNPLNNIAPSRKNQETAFHDNDIQIVRAHYKKKEQAKVKKIKKVKKKKVKRTPVSK